MDCQRLFMAMGNKECVPPSSAVHHRPYTWGIFLESSCWSLWWSISLFLGAYTLLLSIAGLLTGKLEKEGLAHDESPVLYCWICTTYKQTTWWIFKKGTHQYQEDPDWETGVTSTLQTPSYSWSPYPQWQPLYWLLTPEFQVFYFWTLCK